MHNTITIGHAAILIVLLSSSMAAQTRGSVATTPPKPIVRPSTTTNTSGDLANTIEELRKKIQVLENDLKELKESLAITDQSVYGTANSIGLNVRVTNIENRYSKVELDPSSPKKYQRIETDTGSLLISLEDTFPYLDGYKVKLLIGNPTNLTLVGFKMYVRWGPTWDRSKKFVAEEFAQYQSEQQEKEFSFTQTLLPSIWSPVEIILSKTSPSQMALITIASVSTSTIRLTK